MDMGASGTNAKPQNSMSLLVDVLGGDDLTNGIGKGSGGSASGPMAGHADNLKK